MNCPRRWLSSGRTSRHDPAMRDDVANGCVEEVPGRRCRPDRRLSRRSARNARRATNARYLMIERFFDESGGMLQRCTRRSSRVNRAGSRCASASAVSSTSSCRQRPPRRCVTLSLGSGSIPSCSEDVPLFHPASVRDIHHPGAAGCAGAVDALAVESHACRPTRDRKGSLAAAAHAVEDLLAAVFPMRRHVSRTSPGTASS